MISDEFSLNLSSFHEKLNKNDLNEYFKISKKMLYKKYTYGKYSSQRYFINCIIFNFKCRLTHLFKEFLLLDNTTEFLRHSYSSHDIKNILSKILEIYCLYSKIYPNYIILKENKFLYKNIRKKQKMIDEKNANNNKKKYREDMNNIENELFTLSVRNEIKEFEDNSYNNININSNKKNNDRYNQYDQYTKYEQNSINTKKINDNWVLISNSGQSKKDDSKKNNSKNNHFKNMSFDSFWTNDTNNLSILLNAINDQNNNKGKNEIKSKKKFVNSHSKISYKKLSSNTNHNILEVKSSCKIKSHKKLLYKKIENKKLSNDISRNNFTKTKSKKTYINQLGNMNNINNINIKKPISASVSNSKSLAYGLANKSNKIINYLFTEKNVNKNLYHCYSIERDNSENTLKKLNSQIIKQNKIYHKNISNHSSKKFKEKKINSNNKNKYYNNFTRHKTYNNEHLKTVFNESKKDYKGEKSKDQNSKTLYNISNNNVNIIRNRKVVLKRYFTNKNFRKNLNQMHINNLTESYSQTIINCKRLDSSCNETNKSSKIKSLNTCHTASNYYNLKHKNIGIFDKKKVIKKQKTDKMLPARDVILQDRLGNSYIQKKFFSPILNRRYSLSKSCHIKEDKMKNNKKNNVKLIHRQMMNSEAENKLIDIKNNIRTQIIQYEKNDERKYTKSINKLNDINNLIIDFSKENKNSSNKLTTKENRNNKKVYLKKNFSPTMTYFNLYKSGQSDLTHSQNNLINNSDFIEFHHENLFIKKKNSINIKELNNNNYQNKENILSISNQKRVSLKKVFNITKNKTEYSNFLNKHNNHLNINNSHKVDINKKFILKRIKKNNTNYIISKDEKRTKSNISNKHDFGFQRFNNLSTSTINNNSNYNEFTINKNINNSLSNSMNTLTEFQTPLIQKKRLNLIKKFIYQEEKERNEPFYNNKNISNKMAIKVNRAKFLERVKEKLKNKK